MNIKGSKKEAKEPIEESKVQEEATKEAEVQDNVVDVDLSPIQKKSFRLDGDNNRVIRLNTSDLNIASRLEKVYPQLLSLTDEASAKLETMDNEDSDKAEETIKLLSDIDAKMRDMIDFVFDEKVADKAVPDGSMYDPFNGKFAFEYVIERLGALYETNFNKEFALMQKRMHKHTGKYTGKK